MAKDDERVTAYTVYVHTNKKTRKITREFWVSQNTGKESRVGGPSETIFDPVTGKKLQESYSVNDRIHRPTKEGPAYREWDAETGNLVVELYAERDCKYRPNDEPAVIFYDRHTGKVIRKEYHKDGKMYEECYKDGKKCNPQVKTGNNSPKMT